MQKDRYLFRGQKVDAKEWVYGYYMFHETKNKHVILTKESKFIEVIPETVGQFTGLTDKNGVKIFEGDIVKANFPYAKTGFVEFDKKRCSFYVKPTDGFAAYDKGYKMNANKLEIIGNIIENPELLK